ncbi:MAG: chromate efflux transporter [Alphaproteobacteria bacterium]|nr:chromate efflux transporter [Alphaproteobacteria bacterium]MDP6812587.1 chromate efflux transporter [Alphaproteobacteria bacterium]
MTWLKIGLLSFGGPAGQIATMHRILVEEKRWIGEGRFLHALNFCMLLPGPEAQQLAVYVGWLLHRTAGGLVAGILFVLPGAVVILLLSLVYALYQDTAYLQAGFFGIKAAVLAVVVASVLRIGRRALHGPALWAIAAFAFVTIFFFDVPFPAIVIGAAVAGLLGGRLAPGHFRGGSGHGPGNPASGDTAVDHALADQHGTPGRALLRQALWVAVVMGFLWFGPIALLAVALGGDNVFVQQGLFFSKLATVTFGGAYAVLAYMAQEAVNTYGWLAPGEMLDGLGMAETTPGPLIMVTQFVGFLGAYRHPGTLDPLLAGVLGAVLTTWVTFVPCFLWIFLGAPFVERLRDNPMIAAGLSAITAAVVGVVLNLAAWFALHVLFGRVETLHLGALRLLVPDVNSLDPAAAVLALGAAVAMMRLQFGMIPTLIGCFLIGGLYRLVLG